MRFEYRTRTGSHGTVAAEACVAPRARTRNGPASSRREDRNLYRQLDWHPARVLGTVLSRLTRTK